VPLTTLSCFSGIGGLDLGLEAAGFDHLGALEIDADALSSMRKNRPNWNQLEPGDVVVAGGTLEPSTLGIEIGELALIAGGPPCQPFSKAAQWAAPKRGVMDVRGQTVGGMLDLVERFLPRAVLMENVSGFLAGRHNAAPIIQERFDAINRRHGTSYALRSWTVNAADYGVPQHRQRAIVIGLRDPNTLPALLPKSHGSDHRTAWDALGDDRPSDLPPLTGKYVELLPSIPEGSNYQHLTARGGGADVELFGYRTRYWSFLLKLAKDRPAWTLPASPGPSTGPFHWDNRHLAPSERLLLQGFPAEWRLTENSRANVRLAGNATPPPLAEAMGKLIHSLLESPGKEVTGVDIAPSLATSKRGSTPPPATPAAPLPNSWREQVRSRAAHPGTGAGPRGHVLIEGATGAST
jgi:DNA (cytosine-5)-methyltransferase 1